MNIAPPKTKRAVAFIDGQNLYRHAKDAFGHTHPNFDPIKLFDAVCTDKGWVNKKVQFYTGVPAADKDPQWHGYWEKRILAMKRAGIYAVTRPLRYRDREIVLESGVPSIAEFAQEKGIDVRLALDAVRLTMEKELDVAVLFSQDNDLSEVAMEIKRIATTQKRWIHVASAFPAGRNATCRRGIAGTEWIEIDETQYNACLDHRDYRAKAALLPLPSASTPSTPAKQEA